MSAHDFEVVPVGTIRRLGELEDQLAQQADEESTSVYELLGYALFLVAISALSGAVLGYIAGKLSHG